MELKHEKSVSLSRYTLLLIVPYGIETSRYGPCRELCRLLIVPYGIETNVGITDADIQKTFNRTLWN